MRNSLTHQDFALRPLKTVSGAFFTVSLLPTRATGTRFSCVASKKVSLKAVERNRIKRRARAIVTAVLAGRSGVFVVNIKKTALLASSSELQTDLQKTIERLRVG